MSPNHLPKAPPPNTITLGARFEHMNVGGHERSVHSTHLASPWVFSAFVVSPCPPSSSRNCCQENTGFHPFLLSLGTHGGSSPLTVCRIRASRQGGDSWPSLSGGLSPSPATPHPEEPCRAMSAPGIWVQHIRDTSRHTCIKGEITPQLRCPPIPHSPCRLTALWAVGRTAALLFHLCSELPSQSENPSLLLWKTFT